MSGSHHTARQPTRLSSIGRRSVRSIGDRRRVSEADLRRAIYVRPLGLGYHVVKNICNDQEYVVADATNSTFKAGVVVSLGSFTGNPGEFVLGKPPAGFGGASSFAIQRANAGYGITTDPTPNTIPVPIVTGDADNLYPALGWDENSDAAIFAMTGQRYGASNYYGIMVGRLAASNLPMDLGDTYVTGTRGWVTGASGVGLIRCEVSTEPKPIFIAVGPGPYYVVYYFDQWSGGTPTIASISPSGVHSYTVTPSVVTPWDPTYMDYAVSNGKLFVLEPMIEAGDSSWRVVRRNPLTLEEEAYYNFPTSTTMFGHSSISQEAFAIVARSVGGVDIYFYDYATSGANEGWGRQSITEACVASGSPVAITNVSQNVSKPYTMLAQAHTICRNSGGTNRVLAFKKATSDRDDFLTIGTSTVSDVALDTGALYLGDYFPEMLERGDGSYVLWRAGATLAVALLTDAGVPSLP